MANGTVFLVIFLEKSQTQYIYKAAMEMQIGYWLIGYWPQLWTAKSQSTFIPKTNIHDEQCCPFPRHYITTI